VRNCCLLRIRKDQEDQKYLRRKELDNASSQKNILGMQQVTVAQDVINLVIVPKDAKVQQLTLMLKRER